MEFLKRTFVVASCAALLPVSLIVTDHFFSDARRFAPSGTFQVICEKPQPEQFSSVYMDSLRMEIEAKRDAEKVVYMDLSEGTRVMILPAKEVQSRTFRPVSEFVDGSVRKINYGSSIR